MIMTYTIKINKKAQKFIDKQEPSQKVRIYKAIYQLPLRRCKENEGVSDIISLACGRIQNDFYLDRE